MGRSYSFEPMKAQQPMVSAQGSGARLGNDEDQRALAQDAPAPPTTPAGVPVYRQPNAETVQRYQDRAAMREVEKEERRVSRRPAAKKPAKKKMAAKARPSAAKKKTAGAAKKASTSKKAKGARSAGKAKVSRSSAKTRKPTGAKRASGGKARTAKKRR